MSKIKIFALGGLNENGKNMYITEVDNNIFIFDAGLKYPQASMLGVDYIIPKFDYIIENKDKVRGLFLSHAHAGNMGAVRDILKEIPEIPVYGTKLTMAVLKNEIGEEESKNLHLKEIRPHSKLDVAGFTVFPIEVTHSLPETVLYVLYTNDGAICYATDFVFDSTMLGPYKTDIGKLAYVGKQGVLCLMSESIYAYKEGHTSPKHRVSKITWDVLNRYEGRIIISICPTHIYRLQEMLDEIKKTKRKVVIMGKKLQEIIAYSRENNYLNTDNLHIGDLSNINERDVVIITSDNKDKPFNSLEKIITGYDKFIKFKEGDTVFVSEPIYSGNEKKAAKVVDDLARQGVETVTLSNKNYALHHASQEDLMQMINLMNPKYYFPIKGEYRYMYENAQVAEKTGMSKDNIILKLNGDVVTFENGKLVETKEKVKVDDILIDGKNADDIGELVLKDRELLSKNGIVIISATLDKKTKKIISNPQMLTRGFIYVKENHEIIEKAEDISKQVILENVNEGSKVDYSKIKQGIRDALGDYFFSETGSIPMIITVVMEI